MIKLWIVDIAWTDMESAFLVGMTIILPWWTMYILWTILRSGPKSAITSSHEKKSNIARQHGNGVIVPLTDFDWRIAEPLKLRPFKAKYHLTMALENATLSELVAIDKTYLDRIKLRRSIMNCNAHATIACNPVATAAVMELHEWIFKDYLPVRYPSMFQGTSRAKAASAATRNLVTDEIVAAYEPSAISALRNLGGHVDTDFLLLLPSSSKDGKPIYRPEAFVTCFPSGFSTRSKLSKPLAEIHKPVPGYASRLEKSMDRYFAKLAVGTLVKRANWTITTTDALFVEAGTHLYSDTTADDVEAMLQREREDIVLENCRLRAERQTLHRLPKTKALVFAFKTYQYRLEDVRAEGSGPVLADAIEGLANGSVPEMHYYKRGIVWGSKVVDYLRAEA